MHSAIIAWGKVVDSLLETTRITCQTYSPSAAHRTVSHSRHSGNMLLIQDSSICFPSIYPHTKSHYSSLLLNQFIHLSTVPITMNEKKGLKN